MSNVFKDKSKKSKADQTGPNIWVEKPLPELPREGSFRHKVKEGLQNLFSIRTHSRAASRGPSERGRSQEYLPIPDTTTNLNVGDKNRSAEMKSDLDQKIGSVDRASEEAIVNMEDQSMSNSDELTERAPQDSFQISKRQVQVKREIDGDPFREKFQQLDKGKGRLGGAGDLPAITGHPHQDYGTPEADDHEISRNQLSDIEGPSAQEIASQLHGAHHFTIGGNPRFENIGVKNEYTNCPNHSETYDITILKDFKEFVSFGAFYNSSAQDPTRRVHPGTRQRVLKCIRDWIDTPSVKEGIFWLHGPAGVGKSAIAQTIAHSCPKGKLAATFFFFRSDASRNDGNRLFTTLAWQFAYSTPATKNALIHSLIECPDIPMRDVETQFEELIVKPFLALKRSGVQPSTAVVIIDGVDECSDDNLQRRFLKIIGNAIEDDRVPLRFLICSRPEAHIQDTIGFFRSNTLLLDLAKLDDANQDIEKYLKAEFSRIATEQGLDPAWPGEQIIQELLYKASGQFIYAATVIKYVSDEYSSAETQLDIIRGLKPASSVSPFAELDELYKEILRRQRDPVFLKGFLSLLIGRSGTGFHNLEEDDSKLMNVSEKELHRKLRGMRSLLKFEFYIDVHHRSFLDFLQDSSRSGQYHISKQVGTRRYLDFIAGSLVRFALTVIDGLGGHETHFRPRFREVAKSYPPQIVLPVEEWQQALQPLLDIQNKLLTLPNFSCTWEFLPCKRCTGFHTIRNLLLCLALIIGTSDRVLNSASLAVSHVADGYEEMHSNAMPLIPTETDMNTVEKDLNVCLSSLLQKLRTRKAGISLDTDTIRLMCSLLHFDHAEIVIRVGSMLDAQNLVDVIDELINNKSLCGNYSPDISCKAFHLAFEIFTRVPVLPRSLFSKGTVGPHHDVWLTPRDRVPSAELLFQTTFLCKILDPSYIVRVSWIYKSDKRLFSVAGKVNENNESLRQWRTRSNPSSVTRIRVMLELGRALRYFHSMGIVLYHFVDSDDIFLDLELRAKFRFLGLTARYAKRTSTLILRQRLQSYEANIFLFGCLFYEMCFDVEISIGDRAENKRDVVAKRPSKPEIRDDAWELIQRCCAEEPETRPTMDEVVQEMEAWRYS